MSQPRCNGCDYEHDNCACFTIHDDLFSDEIKFTPSVSYTKTVAEDNYRKAMEKVRLALNEMEYWYEEIKRSK